MFTIKICGITSVADAEMAIGAGASALGLNFFPPSPRYVSRVSAEQIARAIGRQATKVGVFVNATEVKIRRAVLQLGLDAVQLHGDEPPELVARLAGIPTIVARRVHSDLAGVAQFLDRCDRLGRRPDAVLLDAQQPGQYGGTGAASDWEQLGRRLPRLPHHVPVILAGGLTPENVARAIQLVRPRGVDVASGVEATPGKKDPEKVRQFVAAAMRGLQG